MLKRDSVAGRLRLHVAPAHIARERDDLAVVQQVALGPVLLQKQLRFSHDAIDPLVVHWRLVRLTSQVRCDAAVAR